MTESADDPKPGGSGVDEPIHDGVVHDGAAHDDAAGDDAAIGIAAKRSAMFIIAVIAAVVGVVVFTQDRDEDPVVFDEGPAVLPRAETEATEVPPLPFVDITRELGIDFVHCSGATGDKYLPESMGSAVGIFDADGDGDNDLFFVDGTGWNAGERKGKCRLYRNDGGTFADVSDTSGLGNSLHGQGCAFGDYDGDGDVDVYITAVGRNRLFRNDGGMTFTDVTQSSGVGGADEAWTTGATFFDADSDGDLDLLAVNYVVWSREIDEQIDFRLDGVGRAYGPPVQFEGTTPYLFRNDGNGRFDDVAKAAGLHVRHPTTDAAVAKSLAIFPHDIDDDGHTDLLIANDTTRNFVFRSKGDGTYEEIGREVGFAFDPNGNATGAMGIDAATYRGNDVLAVGVGNFANEMTSLFVSGGQRREGQQVFFTDEANVEGIGASSRARLTFGLFFFDADVDGRLDLLQANGHLENEIEIFQPSQSYRQPAQLFWNTGKTSGATFARVDEVGDLATPIVGRGAAYGDLDGDGDDDVVLTQVDGPPLVLRNDAGNSERALRVSLRQPGGNPNALGAVVTLRDGGRVERRIVSRTRSYFAQVPATVLFRRPSADSRNGSGSGSGTASRLEIRWPDGATETVETPSGGWGSTIRVDRSAPPRQN